MEADKLFVVISASLLSLATIGFLLVKPLYEEKIKKKIEENEKLHNELPRSKLRGIKAPIRNRPFAASCGELTRMRLNREC